MPRILFFLWELWFKAFTRDTRDLGSLKLVSMIFCWSVLMELPFKLSKLLYCIVCFRISLEKGLLVSDD